MPELAGLKKSWIFQEYYGFPSPPEAADCTYYGKSLLCIANADGTLADEERRWIMGFSYTNGVSWAEVATWKDYEANDSVAELLAKRPMLNFVGRSAVYDAIRACAADGEYSAEEQAMVRRVGATLGFGEGEVAAIESAWRAESGAKQKRIDAIFPGRAAGAVPPADPATFSEAWMQHEYYGIDSVPAAGDAEVYAQLLLCMANSDDAISAPERQWVLGFAASNGVSAEGIERLASYAGTDDIGSLIRKSHTVADARRAVVFDAIRACDADAEYSHGEGAAVARAAEQLDVNAGELAEIENAWAAEKAAKLARQTLVFPQLAQMAASMPN